MLFSYVKEKGVIISTMAEPFGEWLRKELEIRGMIPADLVRATKLSPSYVSNLLNGNRNPGPKACMKIAKAFHLTAVDVMQAAGLPVEKPRYSIELQELSVIFDELPEEDRRRVLVIARSFLNSRQS